mgnify:CR=1 FL=1
MRTPKLCLGLILLVGCGGPPSEVTTDVSTTDAPPTSGSTSSMTSPDDTTGATSQTSMSGSTGEEVCPPMPPEDGGYDPCPGLCGGGGQCYGDGAEYAVCTRGCFMDCNCWPAPAGDGDAPARCSSELLESTSVCVLDCSSGQTCPSGMFCVADLGICAHPYPGSGTTELGSTGGSSSDGGTTDMGSTGGSTTDMGSTGTSTGGSTDMSTGGSTTDMSTGGSTDMSTGGTTGGTAGTSMGTT